MPKFTSIQPITAADTDAVWEFFQRVPEGDRTFAKEPVTERATVMSWATDARPIRQVAWRDGGIVGYVAVIPGYGWSHHVGDLRLVVDPAWRGRGLGEKLARHGLKTAVDAGLSKVTVDVAASQEYLLGFFMRLGFHAEALLEDHVQDPLGNTGDLIVLANHLEDDWHMLSTLGLEDVLD